MLVNRYIVLGQKRFFVIVLSVSASIVLLLSIGLIVSSAHQYMVNKTLKEKPYHVYLDTVKFKTPSYAESLVYKNDKVYIKYKSVYQTYHKTKQICKKIKCKKIIYNDKLLSLYGLSKNNLLQTFKTILISILIILGSAVLILISNAFRISFYERQQQIGVLKSIGMTKGEILKLFLAEGTIILFVSILIGILLSLWLTELLVVTINYLLEEIFKIKLVVAIYPVFIVITFIFIILIFYLACIIPIFKLNRIVPIKLINGSSDIKSKKMPFYTKLFNPIYKLIVANYKRQKKKYRSVKICVFISSVLYISFSLYLSYGIYGVTKYVDIPKYDFEITSVGNDNNFNALKNFQKKYDKSQIYKTCLLEGTIDKQNYLNSSNYKKRKNIIVVDSKQEGIINYIKDNKKTNKPYLKNKVNLFLNENIKVNSINKIPFGLDAFLNKDNVVFFTNRFNNYCQNYTIHLYIKDKSNNLLNNLKKLKIDANYVNVKKAVKLTKKIVLAIKLCLYSILGLIILIGISLLSTTFSFNMHLRTKEFGVFKSIGFTNRNIKRILLIEILIMIFKTYVFIIPLSYCVSYFLYNNIQNIVEVTMIYPIKEIFICIVFSYIIVYFVLSFNYLKIKKTPISKMITNY